MFTNYELLLKFLGEFQSTGSCAKGTETFAIGTIDFYVCVCVNVGLGSSLSKHVSDIQEIIVPVSNKDIVLLLTVIRKGAVYFVLFNLTSIILFSFDSHSESKEESSMLSELSESWCSLLVSGSERVLLDISVGLVTLLTSSLLLHGLCVVPV